MFFEKDTISFNILEVVSLSQENKAMFNSERNFNALSFRFNADTVIKTESNEYNLLDNYVTYVPARLNYKRASRKEDLIAVHFETTSYNTKSIEFFKSESEILPRLFRDILSCWESKERGYKLKCSAIFYEILAECYKQNYKESAKASKIQPSVDYINENYKNSELTVKEAAGKSFMSEVYFRKLFKNEYGTSPKRYIVNLRIQNAVGLISTGYYSLKEISHMCGYADYKYFSTEFKKAMGICPSEYLYKY